MLYRDLSEISNRLLEHLSFIRIDPQTILNCGIHTEYTAQRLHSCYPNASIQTFDVLSKDNLMKFPLENNSCDFIFSNLLLPWSAEIGDTLNEFRRLLKPAGLLLFMTTGPDTLQELRASFAGLDDYQHVQSFIDMHDIGDALMQLFSNPVMDMEHLTINYTSLQLLFQDLKKLNAKKALYNRSKQLTGKIKWCKMITNYQTFQNEKGQYPATVELIYGHAWSRQNKAQAGLNEQGEAIITIDDMQL